MTLVELLTFLITAGGITSMLVGASILSSPREWISSKSNFFRGLLSCPMCTGFWVGLFLSILIPVNPIFGAFMSSVFSWAVYSFVDATESVASYFDTSYSEGEE